MRHRRLTLDRRHALGGLQHRRARGPAGVVRSQARAVGIQGLHLRHGVEGSPDVELHVDATEGL